jgi:arsenate reductase (thioredoxin)
MAEGLLRHMAGDRFDVASAGTEETRLHPMAIEAMREVGIDISTHTSKKLDRFLSQSFDYVITVCETAAQSCPVFPGDGQRIHWSFQDPSAAAGSDQQRLETFGKIRDEILGRLQTFTNAFGRKSR